MSQIIHYKPLSKDLIWLSELTIGNTNKKRLEIAIVKLHQVFFKAVKGDKQAQALVEEWERKIKETHQYFEILHRQYEEKIKTEIGEVTYEPYDKTLSWSVNCTLVGILIKLLFLFDKILCCCQNLYVFEFIHDNEKLKMDRDLSKSMLSIVSSINGVKIQL